MHKSLMISSMAAALLLAAAPAQAGSGGDERPVRAEQQKKQDRQTKKSSRSERGDRSRTSRGRPDSPRAERFGGQRGIERSSARTERAVPSARMSQIDRVRQQAQAQRQATMEAQRTQARPVGDRSRQDRDQRADNRRDRIEDRIRDVRRDSYRDGRREGRTDGYRDGRRDGRTDGYRDGRRDGRHDGYRDGRRDGHRDGLRGQYRDHRTWSNQWRNDRRYNWRDYRARNRVIFRIGSYRDPFGWNYRRYGVGNYMRNAYYRDSYWISDPWRYRLPPVYGPYKWVRYYDDALLVDVYNGRVVDVLYDFFW